MQNPEKNEADMLEDGSLKYGSALQKSVGKTNMSDGSVLFYHLYMSANEIKRRRRTLLCDCILDGIIPKSLEKLHKLYSYNSNWDPDEYVKHMDNWLDYYHNNRDMKCKLFALTLIESTQV